jgi:aerobic carbon-monoxide dehydrogenase small subunit
LSTHRLAFSLNGEAREVEVSADRLLIDLIRDECDATGTKLGCGIGICGACSVLVNGQLMSACLVPAVFVQGGSVITVEGLARDGELTPLQDAFIRDGGFQCGICTPGQLIAATALLHERPRPDPNETARWMMGNLCRCTGYYGITRAIQRAVRAS